MAIAMTDALVGRVLHEPVWSAERQKHRASSACGRRRPGSHHPSRLLLHARAAAFMSAGGYHHHIGLNTWESLGGSPAPRGSTGLYHLAILYPTRAELANALLRLVRASISLDGASDHGVSEALFLRDPDDNGVELYCDRPPEKWPRTADGAVEMFTRSLDLDSLLAEANSQSGN